MREFPNICTLPDSDVVDFGVPYVLKVLMRRQWHPTPVLLSGKSHGRRSLAGYIPWGLKKSDTTELSTQHSSLLYGPILIFIYDLQ